MAPRGVHGVRASARRHPIPDRHDRYKSRFIGSESRRVKINRGALGEEAQHSESKTNASA